MAGDGLPLSVKYERDPSHLRNSYDIFRVTSPPIVQEEYPICLSVWRCNPPLRAFRVERKLRESDLSTSRSPSMFHGWYHGMARGMGLNGLRIASKVSAPPLIFPSPRLHIGLSNCKFLGGHGEKRKPRRCCARAGETKQRAARFTQFST